MNHSQDTPDAKNIDLELLIPANDQKDPEFSLVVPALNEAQTISEFCRWCHEGFAVAGVVGEILIVDSGSDETAALALKNGARVLKTPKRGLGRAYIDATPFIRGKYVIMGDVDCTYDFRLLTPFVEGFRSGAEYVMGSRWKGSIEKGSMPWLHQYFGTPATTRVLNLLFGSSFSDIHCGMRGVTKDGLERMQLNSQSWEYASEMVLKSVHLNLKTVEVPVTFYKDRKGRVSHHKRNGWFSPFQAAWINLKAMFIYGADFFLVKPGATMFFLGLALTLLLSLGPVTAGITFSMYWMLFGLTLAVAGLHSFYLGILVRTFYDYDGEVRKRYLSHFKYNHTFVVSGMLFIGGILLAVPLISVYVRNSFELTNNIVPWSHLAVVGALAAICGFATFTFMLVLHAGVLMRGEL